MKKGVGHLLVVAGLISGLFGSVAHASCAGGELGVYRFNFSDPVFRNKYDLVVFNHGFKKVDQVVAALKAEKRTPLAVVNGGFFELDETKVYSYYKSSVFGNELDVNSARGPRACMIWNRDQETFEFKESTERNYEYFRSTTHSEIYCAGPELVDHGKDVSRAQFCAENFNPKCREDHTDPGINFLISYPRSGSCFTEAGDFILFIGNSSQQKCGISGPEMAKKMIEQGCQYGMNHDGGGSTKFYHNNGVSKPTWILGNGDDRERPVPTWIAIVQRQDR